MNKVISKSLILSLTTKELIKEVRGCIFTTREKRLKDEKIYIHLY